MRCLVVLAHPLSDSLNGHLARLAVGRLSAAGHDVTLLDLYRAGFEPRLSADERRTYYADASETGDDHRLLSEAEMLVLVFPTWWFGFPAILKGWFDRIFAPGVAFDHGSDFGPIVPRLERLRKVVAVTTLGSHWWVDLLVMRRPVRRVLKTALIGTCAPRATFAYLPVHAAEKVATQRLRKIEQRLIRLLAD